MTIDPKQPGWGYEARVIEQLAAIEEERDELREQLAAVEGARDEALTLLHQWVHGPLGIPHRINLRDRTQALLYRFGGQS